MENKIKTLNDLEPNELRGIISDLKKGVRYNEIKQKYNMPKLVFTTNTIAECEKLIAEKEPVQLPKKCTGVANINNQTEEQKAALLHSGATIDKEGYFVW